MRFSKCDIGFHHPHLSLCYEEVGTVKAFRRISGDDDDHADDDYHGDDHGAGVGDEMMITLMVLILWRCKGILG